MDWQIGTEKVDRRSAGATGDALTSFGHAKVLIYTRILRFFVGTERHGIASTQGGRLLGLSTCGFLGAFVDLAMCSVTTIRKTVIIWYKRVPSHDKSRAMPLEVPQVSKMNFFAYDTNADATTANHLFTSNHRERGVLLSTG